LEEVFFDEEIFVHPGGGVLHERVVFLGDEEEADGWVVIG
jgi:hypothetical protein